MKGTLSKCNHKLLDHACFGQVGIVKWIGAETMKVWLDLDPSSLWTFVLTSVFYFSIAFASGFRAHLSTSIEFRVWSLGMIFCKQFK
jgi:hypothetical protein